MGSSVPSQSNRGGAGEQHGVTRGLLDAWLGRKEQDRSSEDEMCLGYVDANMEPVMLPLISAVVGKFELWTYDLELTWPNGPKGVILLSVNSCEVIGPADLQIQNLRDPGNATGLAS